MIPVSTKKLSTTRTALTILAQAFRRPRLFWLLPLAGWHFRRRGWHRRWPFLPLPSMRYLDWRMHTAFGDELAEPSARQLEDYLDWVRRMNQH